MRTNKFCYLLFSLAYSLMRDGLYRKQTWYTTAPTTVNCWSRTAAVIESSIDSQLFVQNRDLCLPTPPAFDAPFRESPSEYWYDVWYGKTRLDWLKYENMITHFDEMYERDRQTDRWRDRHRMTAQAALA